MDSQQPQSLTIGQAAQLLGVSAHTLRFYEKKGLLRPGRRGDGEYRRYGLEDLIEAQGILLLRDCDIGLDQIVAHMGDGTPTPDLAMIERGLTSVQAEILRLQRVEQTLQLAMKSARSFLSQRDRVHKQQMEPRWYRALNPQTELQHFLDSADHYPQLWYQIGESEENPVEVSDEPGDESWISLAPGLYSSYNFIFRHEEDIPAHIDAFFSALKHWPKNDSPLMFRVLNEPSLAIAHGLAAQLSIRVRS